MLHDCETFECMFPDCSRLEPSGLQHIGNLTSLRTLKLGEVPDHSIYVENWWIRKLPESLDTLQIMSELRWHMRVVSVHGNNRDRYCVITAKIGIQLVPVRISGSLRLFRRGR